MDWIYGDYHSAFLLWQSPSSLSNKLNKDPLRLEDMRQKDETTINLMMEINLCVVDVPLQRLDVIFPPTQNNLHLLLFQSVLCRLTYQHYFD